MKNTEIQCTNCAMRCTVEVTHDEDTIYEIQWNNCTRGESHAVKQMGLPYRMMEIHLPVSGGIYQNVKSRTLEPLAESKRDELMKRLREETVAAPLRKGQIVELLGYRFQILEEVKGKKPSIKP